MSNTIASRDETAKAAGEELEQARQKVAYDTASALLELDRNRSSLVLSEQYVARMDQLVSMLADIVKSDPGRGSELTQARARRLQAVASRDLIHAKLREAQIELAKQVGESVQVPTNLNWDTTPFALDEALASSADHPSLRQARAEAQASAKQAQAVRASRFPQVNWVVSKTSQKDALGRSQPWATGLSLQWNAFQGGAAKAAESAALERASANEERAQVATRNLEYQLRTSAEQRDSAMRRAAEYSDLIGETDRVRKAFYEQWFHLGKRTLLDVLIAESEHYNTEIAQVNSRFDSQGSNLRIRADSAKLLSWLLGDAAIASR